MKLAELIGQELKWVQPNALKREYDLHAGNVIAATLSFQSAVGSLATATSGDGSWTFKRVGFWQTKVTIRASEAATDLAIFKNNTWSGGGALELADGRKYLANTNFWATQYEFTTETGETLFRYKKVAGVLHVSGLVEIAPRMRDIAEMPWMVLLGWYLVMMMQMDSGTAATAATAGT